MSGRRRPPRGARRRRGRAAGAGARGGEEEAAAAYALRSALRKRPATRAAARMDVEEDEGDEAPLLVREAAEEHARVSWAAAGAGNGDGEDRRAREHANKRPTSASGTRCGPASRRRRRSSGNNGAQNEAAGAKAAGGSSSNEMDVSSDTVPHIEVADEDLEGDDDSGNLMSARPEDRAARGLATPAITPDSTSPSLALSASGNASGINKIKRSQSEHRPTPEPRAFQRPGELRRKCHTVPRGHVGYTPRPAPPPTPHRMAFTLVRSLRNSTTARRDLRRMSPVTGADRDSPNSPLQTRDASIIVAPRAQAPDSAVDDSQTRRRRTRAARASSTSPARRGPPSAPKIPRLRFLRNVGAGNFASVSLVEEILDVAPGSSDRDSTAAAATTSQRKQRHGAPAHRAGGLQQRQNVARSQNLSGARPRPRLFAVKENIDPFDSELTASYKQMLRSTKAWAELPVHAHVVSILCAWKEHGRIKIQMEFCQGGNLLDYSEACMHAASLPWGEDQIWRLMHDALSGLAHIHAHGLCHNDIKPGNLFLGGQPLRLMLGDFGHLRKPHDEADGEEGDERYIPREALGGHFSTAGDIFMLGISFFEVVADVELPTTGEWHDLRAGKIPALPPGYSEELYMTLRDMMHPDQEQRPSAQALLGRARIAAAKTVGLAAVDIFQTSPRSAASPSWSPQVAGGDEADNGMRTPEHHAMSPVPMFAGSPLNTPAPAGRAAARTASSSSVSFASVGPPGRVDFSPMVQSTPSRDSPVADARRATGNLATSSSSSSSSAFNGTPMVQRSGRAAFATAEGRHAVGSPESPDFSNMRSTRNSRATWARSARAPRSTYRDGARDGGDDDDDDDELGESHVDSMESSADSRRTGHGTASQRRRRRAAHGVSVQGDPDDGSDNGDGRSSPRKCLLDEFEEMDCK